MRRWALPLTVPATTLVAVVAIGAATPSGPPRGKAVGCSTRSIGRFTGVFDRHKSIVVGPLVFAGARTSADEAADTIRGLGNWWKSGALVGPGHTVTVAVARGARVPAGLLYRHQDRTVAAADKAVTFIACRPTEPNDSVADGRRVTFWAGGFIASSVPACIPLDVWIDRERPPRRVVVSLAAGVCPTR